MTELVNTFQEIDDTELRIVAKLGSVDYDIGYIRDDLEDQYSAETFEDAYRDLMANQVSADDFRQTAGFGSLNCSLFLFDENIVFLFPSARYEGVFVSFEYAADFPVHSVVEAASSIPHIATEGTTSN